MSSKTRIAFWLALGVASALGLLYVIGQLVGPWSIQARWETISTKHDRSPRGALLLKGRAELSNGSS